MLAPDRSAPCPTDSPDVMGQRRFRAMNTDISLYVRSLEDVDLLTEVEEVFHALEDQLSRFRPDSELSLLNSRSGETMAVSKAMFKILTLAQEFYRLTDGAFDPSILPDLEAAGYDRSFEQVQPVAEAAPPVSPGERFSLPRVVLDQASGTVTLPAGMRIDLGGIGKGFTVDQAVRVLEPARNFVISAGGDMYASGYGPDGDGWLASVVDPLGSARPVSLVRLYDQALATSTTAIRRWQRAGQLLHHIIDPATRQPAATEVLSASVIATSATKADVYAKTALMLGADRGARFLRRERAEGLFVLHDGSVAQTSGWPATSTVADREEVALW